MFTPFFRTISILTAFCVFSEPTMASFTENQSVSSFFSQNACDRSSALVVVEQQAVIQITMSPIQSFSNRRRARMIEETPAPRYVPNPFPILATNSGITLMIPTLPGLSTLLHMVQNLSGEGETPDPILTTVLELINALVNHIENDGWLDRDSPVHLALRAFIDNQKIEIIDPPSSGHVFFMGYRHNTDTLEVNRKTFSQLPLPDKLAILAHEANHATPIERARLQMIISINTLLESIPTAVFFEESPLGEHIRHIFRVFMALVTDTELSSYKIELIIRRHLAKAEGYNDIKKYFNDLYRKSNRTITIYFIFSQCVNTVGELNENEMRRLLLTRGITSDLLQQEVLLLFANKEGKLSEQNRNMFAKNKVIWNTTKTLPFPLLSQDNALLQWLDELLGVSLVLEEIESLLHSPLLANLTRTDSEAIDAST